MTQALRTQARTAWRPAEAAILLLSGIALTATACSSSSGSAGSAGTAASSAPAGSSASYVAEAKTIEAQALKGPIYSPTNNFSPFNELKDPDTWLGPAQALTVPSGKSIAFVSCGADACDEAVEAGAQAAQRAGFAVKLINVHGQSDVPSLQAAMNSAIALKPTAIIAMAVAATQVADQLRAASKAGIITVSAADPTPAGGDGKFDAAADYPNGLSTELLGWSIVADTNGHANVVAINDATFPAVIRKIGNLVKVVQGCSTCTVKKVTWQVSDAEDPSSASNIITGIINGNPNMNVLAVPYSIGLASVQQAIQASGRDIKVYADDADSVNLAAVTNGSNTKVSAVDPELVMYQAINQVVLKLDGKPYTDAAHLPYLAMLYDEANAPAKGPGAFIKYVNYPSIYDRNWQLKS